MNPSSLVILALFGLQLNAHPLPSNLEVRSWTLGRERGEGGSEDRWFSGESSGSRGARPRFSSGRNQGKGRTSEAITWETLGDYPPSYSSTEEEHAASQRGTEEMNNVSPGSKKEHRKTRNGKHYAKVTKEKNSDINAPSNNPQEAVDSGPPPYFENSPSTFSPTDAPQSLHEPSASGATGNLEGDIDRVSKRSFSWGRGKGFSWGRGKSFSWSRSKGSSPGRSKGFSWGRSKGSSPGRSKGFSWGRGKGSSPGRGKGSHKGHEGASNGRRKFGSNSDRRGRSFKSISNKRGYGREKRPDYSQNAIGDIPPPYYYGRNAPPPPYHPGTYGQRGPSRSYWNGQYYPYRSYGYRSYVPIVGAMAPIFMAGPFGFYGPYCKRGTENCTTDSFYINGTQSNSTDPGRLDKRSLPHDSIVLTNGTYVQLVWGDGQYTVEQYKGGSYTVRGDDSIIVADDVKLAISGKFSYENSTKVTHTINPNNTLNGTELIDNSGVSAEPQYIWGTVGLTVAVVGLINVI